MGANPVADIRLTRRAMLAASAATGLANLLDSSPTSAAPPSKSKQLPKAKPSAEAYRLLVLAANPVGYWRLGETSATDSVKDETAQHHDGRFVGQPRFETPGAIQGDTSGAVVLDGQSYVEIPDDPAFSQPTSGAGLTVEAWMRPDLLDFAPNAAVTYVHWLGKGDEGQTEWGLRFYTKSDSQRPNRISAYLWNLDGNLGAGAYFQDPIVAGEWLHIVACYEPGNAAQTQPSPGVEIFKNGVPRQGPPNKGTLYSSPPDWSIMPAHGTAPLRLGTRDGKSFLVGALDEVAIYPRVLTAGEIRLHYEVGAGLRKLTYTELTKLKRMVKSK
jgi:hypothetical protein